MITAYGVRADMHESEGLGDVSIRTYLPGYDLVWIKHHGGWVNTTKT